MKEEKRNNRKISLRIAEFHLTLSVNTLVNDSGIGVKRAVQWRTGEASVLVLIRTYLLSKQFRAYTRGLKCYAVNQRQRRTFSAFR